MCSYITLWFLGDHLKSGSPDANGPLSCCVCRSITLVYCGQTVGWIKMKLGMEVVPQFSAHVYCSQSAGCTKMPLGMEIGLSPGDIVLDGDPAPLPPTGGHSSPHFSAHVCWGQTAGWIKMPLCRDVDLGPGDIVLDGDPAPQKLWAQQPLPLFSVHV